MINKFPRKLGNTLALSAARSVYLLLDTGLRRYDDLWIIWVYANLRGYF